jgi:hypothetical protein
MADADAGRAVTEPVDPEAIARQIEGLAQRLVGLAGPGRCPADALALLARVRAANAARKRRAKLFDPMLFRDPAWDIVLYLYLCHLEGRAVTVTQACLASPSPATTSLRHLTQLTQAGFLKRVAHPRDGRSSFIDLTEKATSKLKAYFEADG